MRAIRVAKFGGPEVLQLLSDVPIPQPQANQVLIKVEAAGVNPVDTYIRNGVYANSPTPPYTPGHDSAGTIAKVGNGVTKFKQGDRVYTLRTLTGTYAEYTLADENLVYPLGELGFQEGAGLGTPYFTAYRAIDRATTKPGETVLVHGASGAVGLASCQIGNAYGLKVFGTAGTASGVELVQKNGAQLVFNHREENYTEQIMNATGGKGVNVILEMLANTNLQTDLQLLARHGRVVIIGSRAPVEIDARLTMAKETDIRGLMMPSATQEKFDEAGYAIGRGIEQGWVKPIIDTVYPLTETIKSHEEIIAHTGGTKGRIVLVP